MPAIDDLTAADIAGACVELAQMETRAHGTLVTAEMVAGEVLSRSGGNVFDGEGRQNVVSAIAELAGEVKAELALAACSGPAAVPLTEPGTFTELAAPGWEGAGYVSIAAPASAGGYVELSASERTAVLSDSLNGTRGGKRTADGTAAEVGRYLELAASTVTVHRGTGDRPGRRVSDIQGLLPDETSFRTAGTGNAGAFPRTADDIASDPRYSSLFTARRMDGDGRHRTVLEHQAEGANNAGPTVRDTRVSPRGGDDSAEVARILQQHHSELGREAPQSGNRRGRRLSPAARQTAELRARPGRSQRPYPISR